MTYLIDAWLERQNPYLRIIHRPTGVPVVNWQGETLHKKLQNGAICVEDLAQPPSQELVRELFLLDCLEREA
ncbi:PA4570 family protein [Neptuniibacter halophilus]|uniref:PA4570 family protein n=1 Tax=Neptuniibacter halophilus TaxID=651666 RepID=UPI002572B423|nr:hypothetical protein [Neptuniibacter halophilus]